VTDWKSRARRLAAGFVGRGGPELAARCAIGAVAIFFGVRVAAQNAPAAAVTTPVPAPSAKPAEAIGGGLPRPSIEQVEVRLTELVRDATIDMPSREKGLALLAPHWRRLTSPWINVGARPEAASLVQLFAFMVSDHEIQHQVKTQSGQTITFAVRQWNMNEGAYAEREAIVAPTPSTLRFRLRVPDDASLDVAPALMSAGEASKGGSIGEVVFTVRAKPTDGTPAVEVGSVAVTERNRWLDQRFDLRKLAGKEIDLELVAEAHNKKKHPTKQVAVALWGTPQIVRKQRPKVPYDVLWIVVDSLRPDVVASFHDDAFDDKRRGAKLPPGYALLPKVPGLTPNLDALAKRSAIYRRALTAGGWTRPGTVAMLTGMHTAQLGVSPLPWAIPDAQSDAWYAARPPLFAMSMRKAGVATRAFVNNNFMLGYATVGVDFGFEQAEDYRFHVADTAEVTKAALASLRAHAGERAFTFVNYNSPHEPYEPPADCLARVPTPEKGGPRDLLVRKYMAEACKDDAAIGELMAEVDKLGKRDSTIVVITADHGETLAEWHNYLAVGLDGVPSRFKHAFGHYEETTRIPILLSLPGVIPEGAAVDARVTNLDIVPTLLKLEGLDADPRQQGIDLVGLARGERAPDRALITMGRATVAVQWDHWRYQEREPAAQMVVRQWPTAAKMTIVRELYDLDADPGEQRNLVDDPAFKAVAAEGQAKIRAALDKGRPADAAKPDPKGDKGAAPSGDPALHVRFSGAGKPRAIVGKVTAAGARKLMATPIGLAPDALKLQGETLEIRAVTSADALVGFDLLVLPTTTPLKWTFSFDGKALGDDGIYGGALGVSIPGLALGVDASVREDVTAPALPFIDPALDLGAFVVRDLGGAEGGRVERAKGDAANAEIQRALKSWGYAK
jgi:arylsulfatase A-like enzyme